MSSKPWMLVILAALLSGCAAHGMLSTDPIVLTEPELKLAQHKDVTLSPPLFISVVDDQANEGSGDYARTRGADYAASIASEIVSAYPNAIRATTAEPQDQAGSAFIQIRIHKLGAYVNRSGQRSMLGPVMARGGNMGDWGAVIATATGDEPTISGNRYLFIPNNWSGVANLEVLVKDETPGHSASFHFPIVAERISHNDFGMLRASSIADSAWDVVAGRLTRFLEAAVEKQLAEQHAKEPKTQ